jgi:5-methylcytosine-specific restriction endonuclease McrA
VKRSGKRHFDNKDWEWLKRRFKYRCVRCSKKEIPEDESTWLTADHVIPLGMGGSKSIMNIQPLCFKCNQAKGMTVTDYRERKFKN